MSESEMHTDEDTGDAFETPDETLPVEWVPREELIPNSWNPNDMIDDKRRELTQSIMDNGWTQPIVRKAGTDQIIDGEQRWHVAGDDRIAKDEDLTPDGVPAGHIPVFDLSADETQSRVATMQMNVATGEHDADALGDILSDFKEDGVLEETTERLGMDEVSVDRLIERVELPEEGGDPDEMFDIPWEDDEDPDAMTRLDLLVTDTEHDVLFTLLSEENYAEDLVQVCRFARKRGLMRYIRADRREENDCSPEYTPDEELDHDIETDEVGK